MSEDKKSAQKAQKGLIGRSAMVILTLLAVLTGSTFQSSITFVSEFHFDEFGESVVIGKDQRTFDYTGSVTQQQSPLPPKVRLLRIPKAASSSFSAFLRLQYHCPGEPGDCTDLNACPAIVGCWGHFPPIARNITGVNLPDDPNVPMVTFLRNPVERYISAYYYPGHHNEGTKGNISVHILRHGHWNNSMTSFMASRKVGDWPYRFVQLRNESLLTAEEDAQDRLHRALDLLMSKRVVFAGLLEYWEDSIRLFCHLYKCTSEPNTASSRERHNRNATIAKVQTYPYNDAAAMRLVREANEMDQVLYEAAEYRFCVDLNNYQIQNLTEKVNVLCRSLLSDWIA